MDCLDEEFVSKMFDIEENCYEIFGLKLFVNSLEFIRNTLKNFIF